MSRLTAYRRCAVLLLALFLVATCGVKSIRVAGDGMTPTFKSGQDVVVNTAAYDSAAPKRADIILFNVGGERIKRIIGLPAETITITNGSVAVDGSTLSEPYLAPGTITTAPQSTYAVPAGEYFVLNDNRAVMGDSRTLGFVPRSAIEGRI